MFFTILNLPYANRIIKKIICKFRKSEMYVLHLEWLKRSKSVSVEYTPE